MFKYAALSVGLLCFSTVAQDATAPTYTCDPYKASPAQRKGLRCGARGILTNKNIEDHIYYRYYPVTQYQCVQSCFLNTQYDCKLVSYEKDNSTCIAYLKSGRSLGFQKSTTEPELHFWNKACYNNVCSCPVVNGTAGASGEPDYHSYFSGTGVTENTANNGNVDPDFPPFSQMITTIGPSDRCRAAQACANITASTQSEQYSSFDLHWLTTPFAWKCSAYYGVNSDPAAFNVADGNVGDVFGFSLLASVSSS